MLSLHIIGDWQKAAILLRNLQTNLAPFMDGDLYKKGEFVLDRLKSHIDSQDLSWTPLSQRTVELKGGSTTIYIETGYLRDNLVIRRLKSRVRGSTIIIGASPWKTHVPSGEKMSKIMMWLEYGTDKIPPRPLIRPTYDEIKPLMEKEWVTVLREFIDRGGSIS
jgi:hypothetical protein